MDFVMLVIPSLQLLKTAVQFAESLRKNDSGFTFCTEESRKQLFSVYTYVGRRFGGKLFMPREFDCLL